MEQLEAILVAMEALALMEVPAVQVGQTLLEEMG
jgi:hypothetical protein